MPRSADRTIAVPLFFLATLAIGPTSVAANAQPPDGIQQTAQSVRLNPDGTVSIKTTGTPLNVLLDAIAPVCAMDVRADGALASRTIALEISDASPADAVHAILKSSGLDYAMSLSCGTQTRPTRVVVRVPGTASAAPAAPTKHVEDRQVSAEVIPSVPAGPPPEPEKREDSSDAPSTKNETAVREMAPGEMNAAGVAQHLVPRTGADTSVIELPFTDANGQPYVQVRPPKSAVVTLPFPDQNGNPIQVPATGPRQLTPGFPVVSPRAPGTPAPPKVKSTNPADQQKRAGGGLP